MFQMMVNFIIKLSSIWNLIIQNPIGGYMMLVIILIFFYNFKINLNKIRSNEALALFNNNFNILVLFEVVTKFCLEIFEVVQNQISYSKGKGDNSRTLFKILWKKLKVIVLADLRHPDTQYEFLSEQVNAWGKRYN